MVYFIIQIGIIFAIMKLEFTKREIELLEIVAKSADELNIQAYAVGGFVRDKILNRNCKDIDIVCVGNGIDLAKKIAENITCKFRSKTRSVNF